MKGRRPAVVPLSPAVVETLEARRKLTGSGEYVFALPGKDTPFAGWGHGADTLRAALGKRTDWSVHTIRASVATAMVRDLGAEELLVGRILQHSARSALGVTDTYQRSSRLAEQAELLDRWSARLQAVAPALASADKRVVALPVRRGSPCRPAVRRLRHGSREESEPGAAEAKSAMGEHTDASRPLLSGIPRRIHRRLLGELLAEHASRRRRTAGPRRAHRRCVRSLLDGRTDALLLLLGGDSRRPHHSLRVVAGKRTP